MRRAASATSARPARSTSPASRWSGSTSPLPEAHAPRVRAAVTAALRAYYDRNPIYTLRPTDTRRAAARLLLKDVTVRDDRLLLTLGR